jgi:hypothetical protein
LVLQKNQKNKKKKSPFFQQRHLVIKSIITRLEILLGSRYLLKIFSLIFEMKLKLKKLFVIKEKKRNNHNIYERNIPFHFLFLNILLKRK